MRTKGSMRLHTEYFFNEQRLTSSELDWTQGSQSPTPEGRTSGIGHMHKICLSAISNGLEPTNGNVLTVQT